MSNGYPIHENVPGHIPPRSRMRKILLYIGANLGGDLSAHTIAQACMLSTSTLERLFSKYLQQSCRQYVEEVRIQKAYELITQHDKMIKEAMYATGYKTRPAFNKAFKRKYGYPPSHFKIE